MTSILDFLHESNAIEGIHRMPTKAELEATAAFTKLPEIKMVDLVRLVGVYQPDAVLRDRRGLNVRVGDHIAPPGGPLIFDALKTLLASVNTNGLHPWEAHLHYEDLHPFTDGNGRSGRALWLWQMMREGDLELSFLHAFYYQTLGIYIRD